VIWGPLSLRCETGQLYERVIMRVLTGKYGELIEWRLAGKGNWNAMEETCYSATPSFAEPAWTALGLNRDCSVTI
jgi:hypothetical protein